MQSNHKKFAAMGQSDEFASDEGEDAIDHHYVAYVIDHQGRLVELDGMKQGPLIVAENCTDVLQASVNEIQRKLQAKQISESISLITLNAAQ